MALFAERHRPALYQARQDCENLAAVCRGRQTEIGHSQVRRNRHALSRAETGDWRIDPVSQRYWRQAQGSAAALPVALLDGQTERRSEDSLQHILRSKSDLRDRQRANRTTRSRENRKLSFQ